MITTVELSHVIVILALNCHNRVSSTLETEIEYKMSFTTSCVKFLAKLDDYTTVTDYRITTQMSSPLPRTNKTYTEALNYYKLAMY